jgi:asparagine synthase (glutamine-hydrolysing)
LCGIAGILSSDPQGINLEEAVLKMRNSLRHRGPDDVGLFATDRVAIAHTRLSIIDIDGGNQPLSNEDRTIHLVINGEIYNYKNLQQEILSRGHRLRTQSDCEVLLHLYEDEGEDCLQKLEGMYAFALWDSRKGKLFLARDRFGIKPLYIAVSKGTVCFASELTAIIRSGLIKTEIDPKALYAYMALSYVPSPFSILKDIKKVRPAEKVIVQGDSVRKSNYWTPNLVDVPRKKSQAVDELEDRVDESIQSHLVSDVPVAAFLSGGVDSSCIVAMAQRHYDLETFCVSFPNTGVDEAPIAKRVADHLDLRHREVNVEIDPLALIEDAICFMDEPFGDSSALPTFALCRAARKVAKVVLSGDGGDEVFGGYTGRYRAAALKAVLPKPLIIAKGLRCLPPWRNGHRSSLPKMLELAALEDKDRYILERQITSTSDRAALFGHEEIDENELVIRKIVSNSLTSFTPKHPVQRALWMDINTSLADDMLVKVDRMSMANGLEVRVPLLDHRLVEYVFSLPSDWLVSPYPVEGKRLLRRVVSPYLPKGILNRPKHGFVVPLNEWLQRHFLSLFDDLCLNSNSCLSNYIDQNAIHKIRNRRFEIVPRQDLYALLVLELWMQRLNVI